MRKCIAGKCIAGAFALAAVTLPTSTFASNYGGNPPAEKRRMVKLIYREFGHGWLGKTMLCIARRESSLNPRAFNPTDVRGGSVGLYQINGVHSPRGYAYPAWVGRMMNPRTNIRFAHRLYLRAGLRPWGGSC